MGGVLVAILTKVGVAIAEALVARLVYELYTAYARRTAGAGATT